MRITATEAEGDNPDHTVIALTPGDNVATGVGVQLNINGAPLSVNNSTYRVFDAVNRTTVTNPAQRLVIRYSPILLTPVELRHRTSWYFRLTIIKPALK
jgi:hypothetical protein